MSETIVVQVFDVHHLNKMHKILSVEVHLIQILDLFPDLIPIREVKIGQESVAKRNLFPFFHKLPYLVTSLKYLVHRVHDPLGIAPCVKII